MPWTLSSDPKPVYERPLGLAELGFHYDSLFNRTADVVRVIEVVAPDLEGDLLVDLVTRIWVRLKQHFPLLGARLVDDGEVVSFVVHQEWLGQPDNLTFVDVSSQEEVSTIAKGLVNDNLLLSADVLGRLLVLKRKDAKIFHVVIHMAHYISDGMGNIAFLRAFMHHLSTPPEKWPPVPSLENALNLSLPLDELLRSRHQSLPVQRWKLGIAQVVNSIRMAKLKGGHTLPRTFSLSTRYTPARSGRVACHLSPEQSSRVVQTCRQHGITFGSAHAILSQVALSRVLIRRYIKGLMSAEEWEFRKREPMIVAGPINLKPSLDRGWYDGGGRDNVSLAIGFFFYTIPTMPLGGFIEGDTDVPEFGALLDHGRFILRCKAVKKQSDSFVKHPLVGEMTVGHLPSRVARIKKQVEDMRNGNGGQADFEPLTVQEQAAQGFVISSGGSSLGNVDALLPSEYPIGSSGESSTFQITHSETHLHCRPSELYLGASTNQGKLHFFVFWDRNVFEDEVINEWLEEVKAATLFYLGGH